MLCQRMNISYDKNEMKITSALWFYYFSKLIEFFDTIFMILRKHFSQLTFLHIFHHSSMFILWWIVLTWVPVRSFSDFSRIVLFS
jgi:elongation of very long chain fatty acids protein 4